MTVAGAWVTGTVVDAAARGLAGLAVALDAGDALGPPTTVADPGAAEPVPPPPGGTAGGGAGPAPTAAAASIRPLPHPAHGTAVLSSRCTESSRPNPLARSNATAPETYAVAIDVPAIVAYESPL